MIELMYILLQYSVIVGGDGVAEGQDHRGVHGDQEHRHRHPPEAPSRQAPLFDACGGRHQGGREGLPVQERCGSHQDHSCQGVNLVSPHGHNIRVPLVRDWKCLVKQIKKYMLYCCR